MHAGRRNTKPWAPASRWAVRHIPLQPADASSCFMQLGKLAGDGDNLCHVARHICDVLENHTSNAWGHVKTPNCQNAAMCCPIDADNYCPRMHLLAQSSTDRPGSARTINGIGVIPSQVAKDISSSRRRHGIPSGRIKLIRSQRKSDQAVPCPISPRVYLPASGCSSQQGSQALPQLPPHPQ